MTDDQKKIMSEDEEYQFPQEEYAAGEEQIDIGSGDQESPAETIQPESTGAKPDSPSMGKKFFEAYRSNATDRSKRIILVIVVLVIVMIVIHFIRGKESVPVSVSADKPAVLKPVVLTPAAPPQPEVVTQPQTPASLLPPPQPEIPAVATNVNDSETSAKIQELQSQVSAMQQLLTQSQANNADLQKSINALTTQVQTLSTQLKQSMAQEKSAPKTKKAVFYLRAVVPDRAWVMTSSGETVSVSVGDSLDEYGTVLSIDPVYGVIQTSSGRKITYGANDY